MEGNSYNKGAVNSFLVGTKQMQHEQVTQKENHDFQIRNKELEQRHEETIKRKNLGYIGLLLGDSENASKNAAALLCVVLLLGASVISLWVYYSKGDTDFIERIWTNVIPVITLSLGYLFGKK